MRDSITPYVYKPKGHAKMYATDKFLTTLKEAAEKAELTQSAFMLLAVKDKIKKDNR